MVGDGQVALWSNVTQTRNYFAIPCLLMFTMESGCSDCRVQQFQLLMSLIFMCVDYSSKDGFQTVELCLRTGC